MRFKHVLFSSLFLSAALVACTNDEFAEVQMPSVNTEDAIALGEGVTISGVKATWGADTKAEFDKDLIPYWEKTDKVGAAWYNMVTEFNPDGTVAKAAPVKYTGVDANVYSNHPFNWLEEVGNQYGAIFQANTNVMAGAYVLYFPYDETWTQVAEYIPVNLDFPYTINCAEGHEFDAISDNMFSYDEIALVPGGTQTKEFKLHQVPVLYQVQFAADDVLNGQLVPNLTIKKIIMEAYDDNGKSILTTTGKIEPNTKELTKEDYNNYIQNWRENPLPAATYTSTDEGKVDHYTIDVANSDQEAYQIDIYNPDDNSGVTEPFYFSALPFINGQAAAKVVFKVVTSTGTETKVFKKTYTKKTDAAWLNGTINKPVSEVTTVAGATEGQVIKLGVILDTTEEDNVIYTADQFKAAWEAIDQQDPNTWTLQIGDPINMEDYDLTLKENVNAQIVRRTDNQDLDDDYVLTFKSINLNTANLTIAEGINVKVAGDITTTGDAGLTIAGTVAAKNISIEGDASLVLDEMQSLYVAASGVVAATLPTVADKSGSIFVNQVSSGRKGQLTLIGGDGTNTYGYISSLTNNGTVTLQKHIVNVGSIRHGVTGVLNYGTGTDAPTLINKAGASMSLNQPSNSVAIAFENEGATADKAAGVMNINIPYEYKSGNEDLSVLRLSGTNYGVINVNGGCLSDMQVNGLKQKGADARIFVAEKGTFYPYEPTAGQFEGWVVKQHQNAKVENITKWALSVKKVEDLNVSGVNYQFIDAPLTIDGSAVTFKTNTYVNANLTLTGNVSMGNHLTILGDDVEFINANPDHETVTFSVTGNGKVYVPGHLTLGEGVKLSGEINGNDGRNIEADDDQILPKQK